MSHETLGPTATVGKNFLSIVRWCDPTINIDAYIVQRTLAVGNDNTVAGDTMTGYGESQGLVDVCINTDESFFGILMYPNAPPDNYDLDDAIADGTIVNILRPTAGRTIISVVFDGSTTAGYALEEGDWITVSGVAGHAHKWLYADNTDSVDTFELVFGQAAQVWANASTTDRVVALWY